MLLECQWHFFLFPQEKFFFCFLVAENLSKIQAKLFGMGNFTFDAIKLGFQHLKNAGEGGMHLTLKCFNFSVSENQQFVIFFLLPEKAIVSQLGLVLTSSGTFALGGNGGLVVSLHDWDIGDPKLMVGFVGGPWRNYLIALCLNSPTVTWG